MTDGISSSIMQPMEIHDYAQWRRCTDECRTPNDMKGMRVRIMNVNAWQILAFIHSLTTKLTYLEKQEKNAVLCQKWVDRLGSTYYCLIFWFSEIKRRNMLKINSKLAIILICTTISSLQKIRTSLLQKPDRQFFTYSKWEKIYSTTFPPPTNEN